MPAANASQKPTAISDEVEPPEDEEAARDDQHERDDERG